MKVERYFISNFRNIPGEFELDVRGRHVWVKAGNKKGKTSLLDGLFTVASKKLPKGMTNALPSNLVNQEGLEKGAKSVFELKDDNGQIITVDASINQDDEVKLLLKSTEVKGKYAAGRSPRAVLDELVGVIDLDLTSLFNMQPADQVAFIKKLMPSIDFSEREKLLKDDRAQLSYHEKRAKELDAITQELRFDKNLAEQPEVDAATLVKQSQEAQQHNNRIQALEDSVDQNQQEIEQKFKKCEDYRQMIQALEKEIAEHKSYVSMTNKQLQEEAFHLIDVSAIHSQLENISETNRKIREAKNGMAKYNELKEVEEHILTYKTRISNHLQAMKDLMATANFPVKGMTFDENGLYLNGLPFRKDVQNTAELVVAGLQLQVPLMAQAQFMRFRTDGLDKPTLQAVIDWADQHDYQLFMEHVDPEGGDLQIEFIEPKEGFVSKAEMVAEHVAKAPYTAAESVAPVRDFVKETIEAPSRNAILTDRDVQPVQKSEEMPHVKYATAKQKEEIIRLLNNVVITRQEKTKMLLNINKLDEERAAQSIVKLRQVIENREAEAKNGAGEVY